MSVAPAAAAQLADSLFDAYLQIVGAELRRPDWRVNGEVDEECETRARNDLAKELAGCVAYIGVSCDRLRKGWRDKASTVVAWREALEDGRERLRLVMLAWREATDGVRAGTAAWEQRWRRAGGGSGECRLAARLRFSDDARYHLWDDDSWRARQLLAYARLVLAGRVRHARTKSSVWQQQQRERRTREAQVEREGSMSQRTLSEPFTWGAEERMSEVRGAVQEHKPSSGAAAVLLRRHKVRAVSYTHLTLPTICSV